MDVIVLFTTIWIMVACRATAAHRMLLVPIQMRNHVSEQVAVARVLEDNGNDVYMAVPEFFPWKKLTDSARIELIQYRQKDNETLYTNQYATLLSKHINGVRNFRSTSYEAEEYRSKVVANMCRWMMEDVEFIKQVKFMNFDVALVDIIPSAPCNALLPYHLGIKFVSMSSANLPGVGLPQIASFVPALSSEYTDDMTFWQRLGNFMKHRRDSRVPSHSGVQDTSVLVKYPGNGRNVAESWSEVVAQASLFLTLRDYLLEWPAPILPNQIQLSGLTQLPGKRLPNHLDNYMLKAIDGVIVICLGSVYEQLHKSMIEKFFEVFRELKDFSFLLKMDVSTQKDLMHAEGGVPRNVWIVNWLPQNDLLAHKKTSLLISHCGNNGQYEALHHAKPVICLPLYPEQHHNCVRMHAKGYGICMDTWSFSSQMLVKNIRLVMKKSQYREKLSHVSEVMGYRALPSQTAAFWVEYVSRYGGEHMRSAGTHLPYYKYWMLDIMFFFVLMSLLTFIVIYVMLLYGLAVLKLKMTDDQILSRKLL